MLQRFGSLVSATLFAGAFSVFSAAYAEDDPQLAPIPETKESPAAAPAADGDKVDSPFAAVNENDYTIPLKMAPEDNSIFLMSPQLKWDMDQGQQVNIGGLIVKQEDIGFELDQVGRAKIPRDLKRHSGALATIASVRWPDNMLKTGTLEFLNRAGKPIWTKKIDNGHRQDWQVLLNKRSSPISDLHRKNQYGWVDVDEKDYPFLVPGAVFKVCIKQSLTEQEKYRACSSYYRIGKKGDRVGLQKDKAQFPADVVIDKKKLGLRGIVNFAPGHNILVRVNFANGAYLQMTSGPIGLDLLDVVQSKSGRSVILIGQGPKPVGRVKDLVVPKDSFWAETGIERKVVWQIAISRESPLVRVLGAWNIPFAYLFKFDKLPLENDRIFLHKATSKSTYRNLNKLRGYAPQAYTISSDQKEAELKPDKTFIWRFQAPEKGKINRSRIVMTDPEHPDDKWVSHYEMFRGYPIEASTRLTGILTASLKTVLIGEIGGAYWFENLWFSDHPVFAHQRWGVTARYFQALSSIELGEGQTLDQLNALALELRYNIIPGLWNRDELFGVIGGLQNVTVGGTQGIILGIGGYWARTMPKVFDKIFNLVSLLRYPKYVDTDFIYYPMGLGEVGSSASYCLNFHGKVFWRPTFYGELGFGVKQYEFTSGAANDQVSFGVAYGTAGLGFIF